MPTQTSAPPAADLAVQVARALGFRATIAEDPIGTAYDGCNYSDAHDHISNRDATVTIYGTETTVDVCRACLSRALDEFHTDNDPTRTRVEVSVPAQAAAATSATWARPARLGVVVDNDGSEVSVELCDSVYTGPLVRVSTWESKLHFDPSTPHGRAALTALRDALTAALAS